MQHANKRYKQNNTSGEKENAGQVLYKCFTTVCACSLKVQAVFLRVQTCYAPLSHYKISTSAEYLPRESEYLICSNDCKSSSMIEGEEAGNK